MADLAEKAQATVDHEVDPDLDFDALERELEEAQKITGELVFGWNHGPG